MWVSCIASCYVALEAESRGLQVWDSLFVKPKHQSRGIGTELLRYGFAEFGLEKETIWLSTQMRGRNVYRKYGWEDVENIDIDMSE